MRRALTVLLFAVGCGARTELDVPMGTGGASSGTSASTTATTSTLSSSSSGTPSDCKDAGITFIYLIAADNRLLSFYPPSKALKTIGTIQCPAMSGASPFSMGVSRTGEAIVLFTSGELFKVSTANANCKPTNWAPGPDGFQVFGMGFSNDVGAPEMLFVAQDQDAMGGLSKGLGRIDPTTLAFDFVGAWSPPVISAHSGTELTGTGDGRLYGYHLATAGMGGDLIQIDKSNAHIVNDTPLPVGSPSSALAIAFWGGDFYIFTTVAPGASQTTVTRYEPTSGALSAYATIDAVIVGAGVSTCAPM